MFDIDSFKKLLAEPQKIVITTHRNPDGDALGSSFGLKYFLETYQHHEITVVCPSEYPDFFDWIEGIETLMVMDLEEQEAETTKKIKEATLIFSLDYNSLTRVDVTGKAIAYNKTAKKVLIDHHLDPDDFADYILSDTTASSTCELVYRLINDLGKGDVIDARIGEPLFTGLITDTGSFKHATSPRVYRIVADLVEKGVEDTKIQGYIFNSLTEKNLRLVGYCLKDKLEIIEEHGVGIIALDKADYETYDIQRGDTEGIVNMILRIKKVKIAALITEQKKIVKLSLRSKDEISVQEIASKYFNGGGHRNASGGMSTLPIVETVRKFKKVIDYHFGEK